MGLVISEVLHSNLPSVGEGVGWLGRGGGGGGGGGGGVLFSFLSVPFGGFLLFGSEKFERGGKEREGGRHREREGGRQEERESRRQRIHNAVKCT